MIARVFSLLGCIPLLVSGCATNPSDVLSAPGALRVEHIVVPLGIDVEQPRLSWRLVSSDRDVRQTAYRIIVAGSKEQIDRNHGDVWDSGKVEGDQSILVPYAGKMLESSRRYWWKVRVWDPAGRPTDYSEASWWEMGLLEPEDWTAAWISAPPVYDWASFAAQIGALEKSDPPTISARSPLLRRDFTVQGEVSAARLYISGLGYYEAAVNGERVGDHVLDPAFTRYDRRVLYTTYDVTDLVSQGENAIGVMLGGGWYDMPTRAVWGFDHAPWRDRPVLRCQLEIRYADGSMETIVSDEEWVASPGPIVFNSVRQGEIYDARLEQDGWTTPAFDASDWVRVNETSGPAGEISAQTMPPIRLIETLQPESVSEPRPGTYVFDLGQNIAGWARISVSGQAGTEITLKYGERLDDVGLVDQDLIDQHLRAAPMQTDTYILRGNGVEEWEPRFVYHGFQYVEVSGLPEPPSEETLEGRVVHTDFKSIGTFSASDTLLNRIQEAARWAYRGNFHGYPTDCPQREKNGWMGDAHLAAEMGLLNYASAGAYTKWVQDMADEQRMSGELPGIVPTSGWGYHWGNGPAWDSAFLLIPSYVYRYRGDAQLLRKHYDQHKRYVDYLERESEDLIISFGLGDWVPANTVTPAEVTSTAYFYKDVRIVAETAQMIGNGEDAVRYGQLAEDIKTAFNNEYFDPATGSYANGSQTALSCALYQGLVPEDEVQRTAALLARKVMDNGNRIDTGILGAKYVLHALTDNGYPELAYSVASQTRYPGWGYWIEQGATTLWEQWDGSNSLNHIMFGDISAWFFQAIAGIQPEGPGFQQIVVDPFVPDELEWAAAEHVSPYGLVGSEWRKETDGFHLDIEIPVNTAATVYIPASGPDAVTEGGNPIQTADGVHGVGINGGRVVVEIGSGTYRFIVDKN